MLITTKKMCIRDRNNASKPYTGQGSAGMLINMYYSTPFSRPGLVDGKLVNASTDYPDLRMPFTGGSGMGYYLSLIHI